MKTAHISDIPTRKEFRNSALEYFPHETERTDIWYSEILICQT